MAKLIIILILSLCCVESEPNRQALGIEIDEEYYEIAAKTVARIDKRDREIFKGSNNRTDKLMKLDWVIKERLKNQTKDYEKFITIAKDVDLCWVTKTIDTDQYVITLIDSKGNRCSLWLTDEGKVRSITSY